MKDPALPAWAREDAFPEKPAEADPYGYRDGKGKLIGFPELGKLQDYLAAGKGRLVWVWTPEHKRLVAPEEVPELEKSLLQRRALLARDDYEHSQKVILIGGAILAYFFYQAYQSSGIGGIFSSMNIGVLTLLIVLFGLRPWWESRQFLNEIRQATPGAISEEIPEARFVLWLASQSSRITTIFCGLLITVYLVQIGFDGIAKAATIKKAYHAGDTILVFTGPFLHGGWLHLAMNISALWYLGRRVEILARWPHLSLVFLSSLIGGGWATVTFVKTDSVGISGAICGLLGFLLVFESLHQKIVPKSARQHLLGILVSLAVIGLIGFRFIDNASHLGGLLTGCIYALIVFPRSNASSRPLILKQDRYLGYGALAAIIGLGVTAIILMIK